MRKSKKCNFIIDKKLNLLVFVEEICNTRKDSWSDIRRKEWIRKSGGRLKNNEKIAAICLQKAFSGFNSGYLEAHFLMFKGIQLQNKLKENIGAENLKILNESLNLFSTRFNKIWKQEKNDLEKVKRSLNNGLQMLDKIFISIKNISGANENFYRKDIPIHLIASSHDRNDILGWFSFMENRFDLVLECLSSLKEKMNFLILVITHELFHLAIQKNQNLKKQIKKLSEQYSERLEKISKNMNPDKVLEELLISSFVPEGFFSSHFFNLKIRAINNSKDKRGNADFVLARRFCAHKLKDLAKEYVTDKKVIDKEYLVFLISILK